MFEDLQNSKLSPKHQVTLPKGARGLDGVDGLSHVYALPHAMVGRDGRQFPVVVLLVERELRRREDRIRERGDMDPDEQEREIALLNGNARQLAIDSQRRVVLPPHFVRYLGVDREVFMFTSNQSVLVWRPEDWLAYTGGEVDRPPRRPLMI